MLVVCTQYFQELLHDRCFFHAHVNTYQATTNQPTGNLGGRDKILVKKSETLAPITKELVVTTSPVHGDSSHAKYKYNTCRDQLLDMPVSMAPRFNSSSESITSSKS